MRRHEAYPTQFGPPGRPYQYAEFPKMLFKGERGDKGPAIAERCVVNNEDEQRNMQSRGFYVTQQAALDALAKEHLEHGQLAAERNYEIAKGRISEKAAQEVRSAESEHGARHLPMVPETPIKRRGRPSKRTIDPVSA
jgi:hypothetical protein